MRRVHLTDGLEDNFAVAFGLGGLGGLHGHFQGLAEPEDAALAQIILKLVFGPIDFDLQVGLVAVQGRGAEAILLAEGGQGGGPGDEGLVDFVAFGVITDGARHGGSPF